MGKVVIPGFRKIEVSGGGEGGTTNYNDLENKPSINNVPLVGNLRTANLNLTDATLTEEGVPAEAKTVGAKLAEQSTSLTALSEQLGNHTVKSDVPENAVFTDTVYDDTEVQKRISDNGYGEVAGGKNLVTVSSFSAQNNEIIFTKKDDSTLIANGSNYTGGVGLTKIFLAKVGITYTAKIITDLQLNMFIWNSDENILVVPSTSSKEISFSVAKDTHISIAIDTNNVVFNNTEIKVQLEEGSVATSYEPYFPSNKMLADEVNAQKNDLDRIEGISTTEQIVGTFLGKNLYRNTVVLNFSTPFTVASGNNDTCINSSTGMVSQASSYEGNIHWNSIDTLVNAESFAETSSYEYTNPFILTKDKTGYWYCHNVYGTTISATKIVLTLYYTKYN